MSMKCGVCTKTVGFAEAVHRDAMIFHRACFKCSSCGKKIDRGSGLKDQGAYFCNNCHNKQFGPMGFKKGVAKNVKMKTVKMNMQPPFAHVAVKSKPSAKPVEKPATPAVKPEVKKSTEEPKKLHEFTVAVFGGEDVKSLKEYLNEGGADCSKWTEETYKDLLDHIKQGKCELGLDTDGNALRVATVAKVFVYDQPNNLVLYNPLNSFEKEEYSIGRKESQKKEMALLQRAVGESEEKANKNAFENLYKGVLDTLGLSSQTVTPVEIPGNFIFDTTFSPFNETPRDAAARVFAWRFGLEGVTGRVFSKVVPMKTKVYESTHYPGLKSEYHVHHVLLKPEFIVPFQKVLSKDEVSSICLDEITNTGINTHWYAWLKRGTDGKALASELKALYDKNEKVKALVGDVDFGGVLAQNMGQLLVDEGTLLDLF